MAATGGGGRGVEGSSRPPAAKVRRVYEEFMPASEWQQDDEHHFLILDLPGFVKDQIKVSTEGENIIRVGGERHVAGNKWSRFQTDFRAPENCDMNSVKAKHEGGALTVSVEKRSPEKQNIPQKTAVEKTREALLPKLDQIQKKLDNPEAGEMKEMPIASNKREAAPEITVNNGENTEKKGLRSRGAAGAFKMRKTMKAYNEERELLVNMGAAVLVIMLLSAYATYSFMSSS